MFKVWNLVYKIISLEMISHNFKLKPKANKEESASRRIKTEIT